MIVKNATLTANIVQLSCDMRSATWLEENWAAISAGVAELGAQLAAVGLSKVWTGARVLQPSVNPLNLSVTVDHPTGINAIVATVLGQSETVTGYPFYDRTGKRFTSTVKRVTDGVLLLTPLCSWLSATMMRSLMIATRSRSDVSATKRAQIDAYIANIDDTLLRFSTMSSKACLLYPEQMVAACGSNVGVHSGVEPLASGLGNVSSVPFSTNAALSPAAMTLLEGYETDYATVNGWTSESLRSELDTVGAGTWLNRTVNMLIIGDRASYSVVFGPEISQFVTDNLPQIYGLINLYGDWLYRGFLDTGDLRATIGARLDTLIARLGAEPTTFGMGYQSFEEFVQEWLTGAGVSETLPVAMSYIDLCRRRLSVTVVDSTVPADLSSEEVAKLVTLRTLLPTHPAYWPAVIRAGMSHDPETEALTFDLGTRVIELEVEGVSPYWRFAKTAIADPRTAGDLSALLTLIYLSEELLYALPAVEDIGALVEGGSLKIDVVHSRLLNAIQYFWTSSDTLLVVP